MLKLDPLVISDGHVVPGVDVVKLFLVSADAPDSVCHL
jgi:hypothetical protein